MHKQRNQMLQSTLELRPPVLAALLLGCLILLVNGPSLATVRIDDWTLELVERIDAKEPGATTRVTLDLFSKDSVDAEVLGVSAETGWKQLEQSSVPLDASMKSTPGTNRYRFTISGISEISSPPVQLHLRVDGQEFYEELDFSRPAKGVAAVQVPDTRVVVPRETLLREGGPETLRVYPQAEAKGSEMKDTTIRIRGVIAFRRADGTMLGADRVLVKVHDDEGFKQWPRRRPHRCDRRLRSEFLLELWSSHRPGAGSCGLGGNRQRSYRCPKYQYHLWQLLLRGLAPERLHRSRGLQSRRHGAQ